MEGGNMHCYGSMLHFSSLHLVLNFNILPQINIEDFPQKVHPARQMRLIELQAILLVMLTLLEQKEDTLSYLPSGFLDRTKEQEQRMNAIVLTDVPKVAVRPKVDDETGIVEHEERLLEL
ncbi:hypothetical protein Lal_00011363 [Lupinus albus]|nr:hypothetical protein Lal_00011363 [Lupinus albus]